jgi:serine/threonine-protein kinase
VDERTDIWSLGVVLHQLLAGDPPFNGTTVTQVSIAVVQQQAPSLTIIRPDAPPGLAAVVLRCLEKSTTQRFSSIEEFALALVDFAPPHARASLERIRRMRSGHVSAEPEPIDIPDFGPRDVPSDPLSPAAVPSAKHPTRTDYSTQAEWGGTASKRRGRPRRRELVFMLAVTVLATAAGAYLLLAARSKPVGETLSSTSPIGSARPPVLGELEPAANSASGRLMPSLGPVGSAIEPYAFSPVPAPPSLAPPPSTSISPRWHPLSQRRPAGTPRPMVKAASSLDGAPRPRTPTADGWENER